MFGRVYTSFDALPESYAPLFAEAEVRSVFHSREWLECLYSTMFGQQTDLRLYGAEDQDRAHALYVGHAPPAGGGLADRLRARRVDGLTNTQSFLSTLVLGADDSRLAESMRALGQSFSQRARTKTAPERIEIELLQRSPAAIDRLASAFRGAGFLPYVELQEWNRFEDVSDIDFKKKFEKKSTRRREKKLRKAHDVSIEMITAPDDVPAALDAYESIYDKTWKEPDAGKALIRPLCLEFARRGWLRIALMKVDGQPAAAEMFFVNGGVASSFKTAYDLGLRDFSVGSIILTEMLRHVIQVDGATEIDFGPGDEEYKRQWLDTRRELWRVTLFDPKAPRGAAEFARTVAEESASTAARKIRKRYGPEIDALEERVRGLIGRTS